MSEGVILKETGLNQAGKQHLLRTLLSWPIRGLLLFLAAGKLAWPAAWIFWGLNFAETARIHLWLALRNPGLLNERGRTVENIKKWDRLMVLGSFVSMLLSLAVAGLDAARFGWPTVPLGLQIAGMIALVPALALPSWAMAVNTYHAAYVHVQEDREHQVVSSGPYRLVRHPSYLGSVLWSLCAPLALGSWWALIPGATSGAFMVVRTILEDRTLQNELAGYAAYAQQTRYRLLPGIW